MGRRKRSFVLISLIRIFSQLFTKRLNRGFYLWNWTTIPKEPTQSEQKLLNLHTNWSTCLTNFVWRVQNVAWIFLVPWGICSVPIMITGTKRIKYWSVCIHFHNLVIKWKTCLLKLPKNDQLPKTRYWNDNSFR